jgi:hypothetical protein
MSEVARRDASGNIHAREQDRTSTGISHLRCHPDLRPPTLRNLAQSVPIFAISRRGGNPDDADHRIQQGPLDFDDDPGLDACRLVRGRHGAGGIVSRSADRRPSTYGRFAFRLPAGATRSPPENGTTSRPGDEAKRRALTGSPGAQVCESGPEPAVPSCTQCAAARRGPGRRPRRRDRIVVLDIVVTRGRVGIRRRRPDDDRASPGCW